MSPSSTPHQKKAADPKCNVWVSASAGSGKTKVLVDRLARLLLEGADPSKILCLTFTRVAALEMKQRLLDKLRSWALMDTHACAKELADFTGSSPSGARVQRAQELHRLVQEALPGPAIKTFHSFCQGVLQTFALEAGVPLGFRLLEGHQQATVLAGLKQDLLMGRLESRSMESRGGERSLHHDQERPTLSVVLECLSHHYSEPAFLKLVDACLAQRVKFKRVWAAYGGGHKGLLACLRAHGHYLGLEGDHDGLHGLDMSTLTNAWTKERALADLWSRVGYYAWASVAPYSDALEEGTILEGKIAATFKWIQKVAGLHSGDNPPAYFTTPTCPPMPPGDAPFWRALWYRLEDVFLTLQGTRRSNLIGPVTLRRLSKNQAEGASENLTKMVNDLDQMAGDFHDLFQRDKTVKAYTLTCATHMLCSHVFYHYDRYKRENGALDFNDCILATQALLDDPIHGPKVLHALSQDIQHVLMDEAQDTSPEQWSVMLTLITEFLSANSQKTFFIVGDGKQSIYGFQGADYKLFFHCHRQLREFCENMGLPFVTVDLTVSYRSTPRVLEAVDKVMKDLPPHLHLLHHTDVPGDIHHTPFRTQHQGKVHRWPLVPPSSDPENETTAVPQVSTTGLEGLAQQVASHIERWLKQGVVLPSTGAAITPKDIMILLRRRTPFIGLLTENLKRRGIPVEGDDRLHPWSCLALRDLYALGRWVVEPYDDFSLACVLKGPLVGLTDQELYDCVMLSHDLWESEDREGEAVQDTQPSLWEKLTHTAALKDPEYDKYVRGLEEMRALKKLVHQLDVYQFFTHCLANLGLEETYVTVLGPQIRPYLALLKSQALQFTLGHGSIVPGAPGITSQGVIGLSAFLDMMYETRHQTFAPVASNDPPQEGTKDTDDAGKVRILTVHGSKGLQAPVVIIPDAADGFRWREPLLWDFDVPQPGGYGFVNPPAKDMPPRLDPLVAKARQDALQEHCRLLYVAMTRAQDHLYLTGVEPPRDVPYSWYKLAESIPKMERDPHPTPRSEGHDTLSPASSQVPRVANTIPSRYLSLYHRLPKSESSQAAVPISHIIQSAQTGGGEGFSTSLPDEDSPMAGALLRGVFIHKVLEQAPYADRDALQRAGMTTAHLMGMGSGEGFATGAANQQHTDALGQVMGWLEDIWRLQQEPAIGHLLGLPAFMEQPILGHYRHAKENSPYRAVKGRIDRICYDATTIYILDYKTAAPVDTNHGFPFSRLEASPSIPPSYQMQLDLYEALLKPLAGQRSIKKGLIFTNTTQLVWCPGGDSPLFQN